MPIESFVYLVPLVISVIAALVRLRTPMVWALIVVAVIVTPKATRDWNHFHYWLNSKYYAELALDQLYECVQVARDVETVRRDLTTYGFQSGPGDCQADFTPARWAAFRVDVDRFTDWPDLDRALMDKGLNATPPWIALGERLAQRLPPERLSGIDTVAIVLGVAMTVAAFGWQRTGYATLFLVVFYGTYDRLIYGNFAQYLWLGLVMIGVSLDHWKRDRWAGVALGAAATLAIFPAVMMLGRRRQVWVGFLIAAVVMGGVGLTTSQGIGAYGQMIENLQQHSTYIRTEPLNVGLTQSLHGLTHPQAQLEAYRAMLGGESYELSEASRWWWLMVPLVIWHVPGVMFGLMTLSRYYYTLLGPWLLENPTVFRPLMFLNAVQLLILGSGQVYLLGLPWLIFIGWLSVNEARKS